MSRTALAAMLIAVSCALVAPPRVWAQPQLTATASEAQIFRIKPSTADAAVRSFDEPNLVLVPRPLPDDAPLAVFLPGSNGRPENALLLLKTIAALGLRVIGLEYDDEPAVMQVCPKRPQPECSGDFRQQRVFGDATAAPVDNPIEESIVRRLVMLLRHLSREQPQADWQRYLDGEEPRWDRIVLSGLSQGAGMAAYIAKRRAVARVVLFSSPWDFYGPQRTLAPWLSQPSVTPPERWFAAVHRRENTAALIVQAYRLLGVADEHVRVFDLEAPAGARGPNPYHASTIRVAAYAPQWQWLFGSAAVTGAR